MSHVHVIHDTDVHFIIDPITRSISTESTKLSLVQYDHNSERYSFELPRFIEGHDMSLSDAVEIHYDNTNKRKTERNSDFYPVDDLTVVDSDNETVVFSWLISRGCTQFVGKLSFSIQFKCHDENGKETYAWGTGTFSGITIIAGINNTQKVVEEHPDFIAGVNASLKKVEEDLSSKMSAPESASVGQFIAVKAVDENGSPTEFKAVNAPSGGGSGGGTGEPGVGIESIKQTTKSEEDDGVNVVTVELTDGSTETFEIQNGSKGSDGHTPEKGVDYFTEADKEDMITTILSRVTDASEVAY